MADDDKLTNDGVLLRPGATPSLGPDKTLIVSGIGRGGTSLAASVLFHSGVFMGEHVATAVYEDQEFIDALVGRKRHALTQLIARRNASHRIWGFKVPSIHVMLEYRELSLFRNPHLIVIFRDPVAVSVRSALAEFHQPLVTMRESVDAQRSVLRFIENTTVPALLLSYEKALMKPEMFINAIASFCGLGLNDAARAALLGAVQPEAADYIQRARRQFIGMVEFVVDNELFGWCYEVGNLEPITLELYIGNQRMLTFKAAEFRKDLLKAEMSNGNHGFSVDLRQFHISPDQRIEVRTEGREFVLPGSGKVISEYLREAE